MVDISIPQVNFYSMLSGLGDTLAANRSAQAKKDAITAATGPDGKIDFARAMIGLSAAGDPQAAALFASAQNHQDTLAHQAIEDKRAADNDARAASQFQQTYALQKRTADRLDDPTPAGFVRTQGNNVVPLAGGPADPAYIAAKAKAEADVSGGKPVPFETLSGTKFMVKTPSGGYTIVDPSAASQPQAPVPSSPTVVGDAEGVARGLYDPPAAAGQRPPVQVAAAQPANFAARFQGQPAQQAAPAPVAQPQADLTAVDPQTGRRENWLKGQPPDVQAYIKKIADYEVDPRTTSIKGGHREQVMSAVAQYDPTYDQNTFGSRAKAIKDFSTGQQGNSIRSFDVAVDHLDTLQKYVAAMKNGDIPLLNRLRNAWEQETGSSLPTNVQAVAPIVGAEVSKAIIGSNNALADREELRQPLQGARSPEQLAGAIQAYKSLMTGQLKGLSKQYEDTTGKKNFNSRLRQGTLNVLMGDQTEGKSSDSNTTSTGIKWSLQ